MSLVSLFLGAVLSHLVQIANFNTNGFEVALSGSPGAVGTLSPERMIAQWDSSGGHRAVLVNSGPWANYRWQSVAFAANNDYAAGWFAIDEDTSTN